MEFRPVPLVSSDVIWLAPGPVPTVTSLARAQGWLAQALAAHGFEVRSLFDSTDPVIRVQHFYHDLKNLIREGGNVFPLWRRAHNLKTRGYDDTVVVGLTSVDEVQVLLAQPGLGLNRGDLSALKGRVFGVSQSGSEIDVWRAMALRGFDAVLKLAGLGLGDVVLRDIAAPDLRWQHNKRHRDSGSYVTEDALLRGEVEVIFAKGATAVQLQREHNLEVVFDINTLDDPRLRGNNGTPRPITVHRHLLNDRPDLVRLYLQVCHLAARWATRHPREVARVIAAQTGCTPESIMVGYGPRLNNSFDIKLNEARITALQDQADFLHAHGLIEAHVDVRQWVDTRPLLEALAEPLVLPLG